MRENAAELTAKFHVKNGKAMCTNEFAADLQHLTLPEMGHFVKLNSRRDRVVVRKTQIFSTV